MMNDQVERRANPWRIDIGREFPRWTDIAVPAGMVASALTRVASGQPEGAEINRLRQPTQVEAPESSRALSMRPTRAFRKSARTSCFWDASRSQPTDARDRASSLPSRSGGRRFVAWIWATSDVISADATSLATSRATDRRIELVDGVGSEPRPEVTTRDSSSEGATGVATAGLRARNERRSSTVHSCVESASCRRSTDWLPRAGLIPRRCTRTPYS